MLTLVMRISVALFRLTRWLPSSIILALLRTRRGLKYGVPAMLLAIPYGYGAWWLEGHIATGSAEKWCYLIVMALAVAAFRFVVFGPRSLLLLASARITEARAQRRTRGAQGAGGLHTDAPDDALTR